MKQTDSMNEDMIFTEEEEYLKPTEEKNEEDYVVPDLFESMENKKKSKTNVMDFFNRLKKKNDLITTSEKNDGSTQNNRRIRSIENQEMEPVDTNDLTIDEEYSSLPPKKRTKRSYKRRTPLTEKKRKGEEEELSFVVVDHDNPSHEFYDFKEISQNDKKIDELKNKSSKEKPILEIIDLDEEIVDKISPDLESKSNNQNVSLKNILNGRFKPKKSIEDLSTEKKLKNKKDNSKKMSKIKNSLRINKTNQKDIVEILTDEEDEDSFQEALTQISEKEKAENLKALELKIKQSMLQTKDNPKLSSNDILAGKRIPKDVISESTTKTVCNNLSTILTARRINYKNPIAKLKEIEPPVIPFEQFIVQPKDTPTIQHRAITGLTKMNKQIQEYKINEPFHKVKNSSRNSEMKILIKKSQITREDILSIISTKHPEIPSDFRFNRLLTSLEKPTVINTTNELLCDFFKPQSFNELLSDRNQVEQIRKWIIESFKSLKKTTLKRPNFSKRKVKTVDEFDNFIVYNDEEEFTYNYDLVETDDDDEELYTPLLIVEGDEGVGKSTIIHTILKDMKGYIHEINTGQSRGRKDILNGLRELVTTQLVHNSSNETGCDKGVILFEDVDVLFEEDDKGFWSVISEVLQISRRPVIMTCKDMDRIPWVFLEALNDDAKVFLKPPEVDTLIKYLYLIALNYGYDVEKKVLSKIVRSCDCDLRKSLMILQNYLSKQNTESEFMTVSMTNVPEKNKSITKLEEYAKLMDIKSHCNIIKEHTFSQIPEQIKVQEFQIFGQDYQPYEIHQLSNPLLPFELDICKEFTEILPTQLRLRPTPKIPLQELKNNDYFFLISRLQRFKRLTRSIHTNPNLEPTEESDFISYIQKLRPNEYLLDVSPCVREFARFEILVKKHNIRMENEMGKWLQKENLMFGNFNDDPFEFLGSIYSNWK